MRDPRDLEDEEWPLTAAELHGVVAWARGTLDRAAFRRILRARYWPDGDIEDLTCLLEHVLAADARMPSRG